MDVVVQMSKDNDSRHYRVFASEDDYMEIRSSVHNWTNCSTIDIEPTEYQDNRCLYYCMGFKLLVELDEDRKNGEPVIISV